MSFSNQAIHALLTEIKLLNHRMNEQNIKTESILRLFKDFVELGEAPEYFVEKIKQDKESRNG